MLITFSGVDGSGKSTQMNLLHASLEARGHRCVTLWFRPGYSREMDALRAAVRRLRPGSLPRSGEARERAFQASGVRQSWMAMAWIDTWIQYGIKVRARLLAGQTVICDRYLADAMLDLEFRFPEMWQGAWSRAWRGLERVVPRPDVALLLMLPWEEMERRLEAKDEPFPDPVETRGRRYAAYERMAASGCFEVIDASPEIKVVGTYIEEVTSRVDEGSR